MNDKAPMSELLQWLAGAPRTYRWDAILAYDRDKTNTVLRQEYIERFDEDSYLPPFTELIPTTDDTAQYTYDYVFDAARLSFINSTIASSRAQLTQKVIGGSQLTLSKPSGSMFVQVQKVYSLDAMDGPLLEGVVYLDMSTGAVNSAGEVILDIGAGEFNRLTFASTDHERKKGGDHFRAVLKRQHDKRKILVLNQLALDNEQVIKPREFAIRTHAAPNSRTPGTQEFGSGAVLVFITMAGGSNGSIPVNDKDMPFLIPDGHSATVLLGQEFLVVQVFALGCRALVGSSPFDFQTLYSGMFLKELKVTRGTATIGRRNGSSEHFDLLQLDNLTLPLADADCTFSIFMENQRLVLAMRGTSRQMMQVKLQRHENVFSGGVVLFWDVKGYFQIETDKATGSVRLVKSGASDVQLRVKPGDFADSYHEVAHYAGEIVDFVEQELAVAIERQMVAFAESVGLIDVFRLNSLLFRGDNAVTLDSAHLPGDMALFGRISPRLTEFVIGPLEPIIGHGDRQQFSVTPPQAGVTWSLEHLPGGSGPLGSISAQGLYTAPPASDIAGVYLRLKVKATQGQHTSTALATVVVRDISVNPVVQVCGQRDRRAMSAGTLGAGVLNWKIRDPDSGASIELDPDPDGDRTYIAGSLPMGSVVQVDEVVVTNSMTQKQQSAYVVVTGTMNLEIGYELTANPDQLQCTAYFSFNGEPVQGFDLEWKLLVGSGSIDANGLFTVDHAGQHRFAVITTGFSIQPPLPPYMGLCILPLPLIELPDLIKARQDAAVLFAGAAKE